MVSFFIWFNFIAHEHKQVIAEIGARQAFPYTSASAVTCNTLVFHSLASAKWSLPVILNCAKLCSGFMM